MTRIIFAGILAVIASPAIAQPPPTSVPEMSAGAGIAAVALLAGVAAIIRERRNGK